MTFRMWRKLALPNPSKDSTSPRRIPSLNSRMNPTNNTQQHNAYTPTEKPKLPVFRARYPQIATPFATRISLLRHHYKTPEKPSQKKDNTWTGFPPPLRFWRFTSRPAGCNIFTSVTPLLTSSPVPLLWRNVVVVVVVVVVMFVPLTSCLTTIAILPNPLIPLTSPHFTGKKSNDLPQPLLISDFPISPLLPVGRESTYRNCVSFVHVGIWKE
jgi:hypothetical protein